MSQFQPTQEYADSVDAGEVFPSRAPTLRLVEGTAPPDISDLWRRRGALRPRRTVQAALRHDPVKVSIAWVLIRLIRTAFLSSRFYLRLIWHRFQRMEIAERDADRKSTRLNY